MDTVLEGQIWWQGGRTRQRADAFIMFYHIICVIIHAFAISYSMIMHIGATKEITLLEFNEEEEGGQQETPQAIALGEEEQTPKELPEHSKSPSVLQNTT